MGQKHLNFKPAGNNNSNNNNNNNNMHPTTNKIFFFFILALQHTTAVVATWHWEVYETHGKICDPAPIGVPAFSEQQCQNACAKHADVKFCQFNVKTRNWCMMGYVCTKQWLHPTHRYIVWVKVDDHKPHPGHACIKLVHGEACPCKPGNCETGKPDIRKWLGGKCGVAVTTSTFTEKMIRSAGHGLSWQYNWGTRPSYSSIKHAPMFWGPKEYNDFPKLHLDGDFQPSAENKVLPILLGFNEPDMDASAGGSAMSVDTAVKYWKKNVIQGILKGYRQFVSPAMARPLPAKYNKGKGGHSWLGDFFDRLAREPRFKKTMTIDGTPFSVEIDWKSTVDYIAMHKYEENCHISMGACREWDYEMTAGAARRMMDDYNKHKGFNIKGVWLTEIAGAGWDGRCRERWQQKPLMEKFIPMLLKDDAVVAIAWFSYGEGRSKYYHSNANLWNYRTGALNELGSAYFNFCKKHRY